MSDNKIERRAYFFLGQRPGGRFEGYSHSAVVLAEGLRDLGWAISSDVRAWQMHLEGEYLFPGGGVARTEDADLIVFAEDYFYLQGSDRLPELSAMVKAPKIYLDRSDLTAATGWINQASMRQLDLILRSHATGYFNYPSNVRPTVFGISHRIADACAPHGCAKQNSTIWNFNHGRFPHSVRVRAESKVLPMLASRFEIISSTNDLNEMDSEYARLMRQQTDGRHFTSYYERQKRATLCACFGGWFLVPCRQQEAGPFCMWTRRLLKRLPIVTSHVAQWDSWRLWETFASGTVVLHVDFEKHKFLTGGPLPEAMKHYVAVDIKDPAKSLLPILDQREELLRIGETGRRWALEHYSSRAITLRTLQSLSLSARSD